MTFLYLNYINDFEFILQSIIYKTSWIFPCYMSYFNALFYIIVWYIVSKLAHILIWGKYLWNVYLFQNYNFDDNKIRDRQSLKLPLPSRLQSQSHCLLTFKMPITEKLQLQADHPPSDQLYITLLLLSMLGKIRMEHFPCIFTPLWWQVFHSIGFQSQKAAEAW